MPPFGPLLKNDGPACRVCGCTEHNACLEDPGQGPLGIPCHWVQTKGADEGPLCSACSGTAEDLAEAIRRAMRFARSGGQLRAAAIQRAALARYEDRKKGVDAVG